VINEHRRKENIYKKRRELVGKRGERDPLPKKGRKLGGVSNWQDTKSKRQLNLIVYIR